MVRKKITTEDVNLALAPRGIVMLSTYISAKSNAIFKCSNGHSWEARVDNVKGGRGCPYCASRTLDLKEVNKSLAARGIKMEGTYINSKSKIMFSCENGHMWESTLDSVRNHSSGCPICLLEKDNYPTNVYILISNVGTKIGVSSRTKDRLRDIKTSSNIHDLKIFKEYSFSDRSKAIRIEREAHLQFKEYNCQYKDFDGATEFFNIEPEVVARFIEEIINDRE